MQTFFYFAILCAAGKFLKLLACPSVIIVILDIHAHRELYMSNLLITQASMMSRKQKKGGAGGKKRWRKCSSFNRDALIVFSVKYEGQAPRVFLWLWVT